MKITDEAVEAFTQYRRKQIAELRPWQPGADMTSVSVSPEDTKAGSPKPGDMIARNPKNHADQWLVAAAYFADNFEPISALPHLSQGAVRVKPLEWKVSGLRMFVADTEIGQYAISRDPYSAGGYFNLWMAGADEDTSSEYPSLPEAEAAAQADYERRTLSSALASHEPAPTDTQDGLSEAGEVVAYLMEGSTVTWLQSTSGLADCDKPSVTPVPLIRQSALTACQQEVETLREGIKEIAEREQSIRDNWTRFEAETGARTLELETDLEIANDKLRKMVKALASVTHQLRGWQPEEVALDSDLMEDAPAIECALRVLGRAER